MIDLSFFLLPRRPKTILSRFATVAVLIICLLATGCDFPFFKPSFRVSVPSQLSPLISADTQQLIAEINRVAEVRSIRGKADIEFLDTSFAKCGVAEKYRTADATVTLQRPGQVRLEIQIPFVGTNVAQMTSNGAKFQVAVLLGEERYKKFLRGTNDAVYPKLEGDELDCGEGSKSKVAATQQRTVGALSGLRPQHFTDALLVRPVVEADTNYLYVRSETFEEELDPRPGAKRNTRVVHGYYVLDELAPESGGRTLRLVRRFWVNRYQALRLARLQTFNEDGQITTDVLYKESKGLGENGRPLPSVIELTRPQDRYSLRVSYQTPETVKIDNPYDADLFVLQNSWQLPEVDLDQRQTPTQARSPRANGQ